MNYHKTPDPPRGSATSIAWSTARDRDVSGGNIISKARQQLSAEKEFAEATDEATAGLVTNLIENLRENVNKIEADNWMYEDKPF
mmetsp:Transcript_1114/g.1320  ORF Transcript_1114/g.1320 Transcript_1114/m.1320 type:complete len:85 (+) Transcript_1114:166-420(+)